MPSPPRNGPAHGRKSQTSVQPRRPATPAPSVPAMSPGPAPASSPPRSRQYPLLYLLPGPRIELQQLVKRWISAKRVTLQNRTASRHNFRKCHLTCEKAGHGGLISRIHHCSSRATRSRNLAPQSQRRKAILIRWLEIELQRLCQIKLPSRRRCPIGPGQGILNRQLHVRRTKLGDHRPVDEFYQRVNNRLRMNDHVDLVGSQIKEPPRLDNLQCLIHHRGRIDRDFLAHLPRRMRQGVGYRGSLHFTT